MSLRTLARASALYTLGNIAPKVGAVVLLPIYLRFLTPAEYGAVALLTSLSTVLGLLIRFGLDSALMRLHFDYAGRARAALYGTLTLFTLGTGAAATLLAALALGPFFPTLFAGISFFPLGGLSLLIAFVTTTQFVPSVLFRATGQAGRFVSYNLASFVIGSLTSVLLITVAGLGAVGLLLGQLVGALVVFVIALVLVSHIGSWSIEREPLVASLRFGLPLVPHSLASWALRLSDRWMIGILIGLPVLQARAAIGVYSFGYQIGYIVAIVIASFNAAWSPYFFRIGESPIGPRLFRHITTLVMAGLMAMAAGLAVLAPEAVATLSGSRYEEATNVIRVVAFASAAQGLYTMLVTVVFLTKNTGRLALLTTAAAIANVGMNLLLIPRLGIIGAAWSTLAAYALFALMTGIYARARYPLELDLPRLVVLGSVALGTVAVGSAVTLPVQPVIQGVLHLAIGIVGAGVCGAVAFRPLMDLRGITMQLAAASARP